MQINILLQKLAKPAQRAIQNEGLLTIEQLLDYGEKELSELHGIGQNAMNIIRKTLSDYGYEFQNKNNTQ